MRRDGERPLRQYTQTGQNPYGEPPRGQVGGTSSTGSVGAPPRPTIGPLPSPLKVPDPRSRFRRPRWEPVVPGTFGFMAIMGLAAVFGLVWGWQVTRVDAELTGFTEGVVMTPDEAEGLAFSIDVSPSGRLEESTLTFDGIDVLEDAEIEDDRVTWEPEELAEGEHVVHLSVPRPFLGNSTMTWTFTVDGTPPRIDVPPYLPPQPLDEPVVIEGRIIDGETLRVDGEPYELEDDGSFRLTYPTPPTKPIRLAATDGAGNRRATAIYLPVEYPEKINGIHVTAAAWHHRELRRGVVDLIDAGVVDTVVLSIKDEGGLLGHTTDVDVAERIGASLEMYDLEREVDYLHRKGVRVIGRVVAFRDPKLADMAWESGRRDMLIQDPQGGRYAAYGGAFVNFAHPSVQAYNLAVAEEAVRAGVDDILWDYIRRPDGYLEDMQIPGLEQTPEDTLADFLAHTHERIRALGAVQGASVFGVAATRPEQIGQDILKMAGHTDYIAPMLYPSHWNKGEYRLADPESEPYEIIKRSLRDFEQQVVRTGRPLVPWLQHFSMRVEYGPGDIQAQIRAVRDTSNDRWMMWDPGVTYSPEGLQG